MLNALEINFCRCSGIRSGVGTYLNEIQMFFGMVMLFDTNLVTFKFDNLARDDSIIAGLGNN